MQKSSIPDTSLGIDQYELRRKVNRVTQRGEHKKITDNRTSDQIVKFDSHP